MNTHQTGGRQMTQVIQRRFWRAAMGAALAAVVMPGGASAQPAAATPAPAQAAAAPATPTPAETYSYNPEGRRDPFVSLLVRGGDGTGRDERPTGREGLLIADISVRGIVKARNTWVAMLQGPDNRTHIVHSGDKLLDGVIKAITADAVIFSQDVNDPLSLVKQREVRKVLRGKEEGT
jgi:Tfp pilus assembly protein PilP